MEEDVANRNMKAKKLKFERMSRARAKDYTHSIEIKLFNKPERRQPKADFVEVKTVLKAIPDPKYFSIIDNVYQRCVVFHDDDKTCFIIVHTDKRTRNVRRSIAYGSKSAASAAWYTNRVIWIIPKTN